MWLQDCPKLHVELFPHEKTDGFSGERLQWAPVLHFLSIYALDRLLVSISLLHSDRTTFLTLPFTLLLAPASPHMSAFWLSSIIPPLHELLLYFNNHFHQPLDLCLLLPPPSVSSAPTVPTGGSSLLPTLSGSDFCCIPPPLSPPARSCSIALPTNTWCHYLRKGLEHPPWFSLVLPLAWSTPSPTQVCKSLLSMSASKLVYPPPIPAFITLPKWSDISSAEASRRCSQYPNHESWHNKWRQSAGGPGHLSHCATSRCQLHYSLKLPEKIT